MTQKESFELKLKCLEIAFEIHKDKEGISSADLLEKADEIYNWLLRIC